MKTRHLEIDIRDVAVGDEFSVESRTSFWNAFQDKDQTWVGAMVHQPILNASFLVVLPADRPYKTFRLRAAEIDGDQEFEYEGEQLIFEAEDQTWLYWEIVEPDAGFVYQVHVWSINKLHERTGCQQMHKGGECIGASLGTSKN